MEDNEKKVGPAVDSRPEKMTYEQLENIAHQLSDQAKQLYAKLQDSNMENTFRRLDYLFKVIAHSNQFNDEFVKKCSKEIESVITIPEGELEDYPTEE